MQQARPGNVGTEADVMYERTSTMSSAASHRIATTTQGGIVQQPGAGNHVAFPPGAKGYSTGARLESENMMYQGMQVIGEKVQEYEVKVPRVIRHEEIREKTIVIPEKYVREEVVEETKVLRERVIQVAKPIYREKIVEVPVQEFVEKIVEVPEYRTEWREIPVEKVVFHEVTREVKVPIEVEKIVEVEEVHTRDVPVVKQVEVVEQKIVYNEVPRPIDRYVTVDVPEIKEVEVFEEVYRRVPVAAEHIIHQDYNLPELTQEYEEVPYPVFVPAFTEIPIPADLMTEESKLEVQAYARQVAHATAQDRMSLCVIEDLGAHGRRILPNFETNPHELQRRYEKKFAEISQQPAV